MVVNGQRLIRPMALTIQWKYFMPPDYTDMRLRTVIYHPMTVAWIAVAIAIRWFLPIRQKMMNEKNMHLRCVKRNSKGVIMTYEAMLRPVYYASRSIWHAPACNSPDKKTTDAETRTKNLCRWEQTQAYLQAATVFFFKWGRLCKWEWPGEKFKILVFECQIFGSIIPILVS